MLYFPKYIISVLTSIKNAKEGKYIEPVFTEEELLRLYKDYMNKTCFFPTIISNNTSTKLDLKLEFTACNNPYILKVLYWIHNNILYTILEESYMTIGIKLRIATSMLNKLVKHEILTKDEYISIYSNIQTNIYDLKRALTLGELPFQGVKHNGICIPSSHYTADVCYISL